MVAADVNQEQKEQDMHANQEEKSKQRRYEIGRGKAK